MLSYVSALLTFLSVWLAIGEREGTWVVGIGAVIAASIVLVQLELWGQCIMQVAYLVTNIYGWWAWRRPQGRQNSIVRHASGLDLIAYAAIAAASYGLLMGLYWLSPVLSLTPSDAILTACSLAAQVALAKKRVEVWCFWIAIDAWSAWWFYTLGEYGFVLMFGGLSGIAVYALYQWHHLANKRPLNLIVRI